MIMDKFNKGIVFSPYSDASSAISSPRSVQSSAISSPRSVQSSAISSPRSPSFPSSPVQKSRYGEDSRSISLVQLNNQITKYAESIFKSFKNEDKEKQNLDPKNRIKENSDPKKIIKQIKASNIENLKTLRKEFIKVLKLLPEKEGKDYICRFDAIVEQIAETQQSQSMLMRQSFVSSKSPSPLKTISPARLSSSSSSQPGTSPARLSSPSPIKSLFPRSGRSS
jgi:hypothetical protein